MESTSVTVNIEEFSDIKTNGDKKQKKSKSSMVRTPSQRVVEHLKYIIFPDNKWIKWWDLMIIGLLGFLLFILPYQIGVSNGFYLLNNKVWLAINIAINCLFFVDNILYFFRAYRDKDGRMVLDLKTIRRNYLKVRSVIDTFCLLLF